MSGRHFCRPKTPLRDFRLDGTDWIVYVCECGKEMIPRTRQGRLAPPMVEARLNRDYGLVPVHRHLPEQTVCRWDDL